MKSYCLIDIGGTAIKYGLLDENEKLYFKDQVPTQAEQGGPFILATVLGIVQNLINKCGREHAAGIAISSAGMVEVRKGYIFHAGPTIPNFKGTQFKKTIEETFGIPCEIENDVNCAGLAEFKRGAGRGASSMLCLTIGTGIGGCAVIDGKVLSGFTGSGCEVGYMRVRGQAFETLGAASVLTKTVAARKNAEPDEWDGIRVFEAAKTGDADCIEAIDAMCDILGEGIANICYVLNPEMVVLGGGVMAQKEYLYPRIRKALDTYLIPVMAEHTTLRMAELKNDAGMFGAYYHFQEFQEAKRKGGRIK